MLSPDHVYVGTSVEGTATITKPRLKTTAATAPTTIITTPPTPTPTPDVPILPDKSLDLLPIVETKRKFSFPLLNTTSLLSEPNTFSARRRFSNVSDVVTRKLSSTIGWKMPVVVPTQDLVTQGKCLCGQYIRNRLKRSGLFTKKLGLQRLRSIIGTPSALIVREVFPALNYVKSWWTFFWLFKIACGSKINIVIRVCVCLLAFILDWRRIGTNASDTIHKCHKANYTSTE